MNLRLGLAYLDAQRDADAYRSLLLVRRLHPANWAAAADLAVLHARAEQPEPAGQLLTEALELGGDDARAFASGFPILAPLLGD